LFLTKLYQIIRIFQKVKLRLNQSTYNFPPVNAYQQSAVEVFYRFIAYKDERKANSAKGGKMGGGSNIGRFDLGLTGVQSPIQDFIQNQVMNALSVSVQTGDHAAAKQRFENVRELLKQFNPQEAGELLDHLNEKHSKDPLAKEIKYRFSDSSIQELKKDLEMTSGRWADKHLTNHDSLLKGSKNNSGELRSQADAAGKTKRSNLDEIWNSYMNAEKIHSALMSKDVVNEEAITEILSNLSKKEKKELKHAYKEKYGEDLVDEINAKFSGPFRGVIGFGLTNMLN
jgi:annexin-like protein